MRISDKKDLFRLRCTNIILLDMLARDMEYEVFPHFDEFSDNEINLILDKVKYYETIASRYKDMFIIKIGVGKYSRMMRHIRRVHEQFYAMFSARVSSEALKECKNQTESML